MTPSEASGPVVRDAAPDPEQDEREQDRGHDARNDPDPGNQEDEDDGEDQQSDEGCDHGPSVPGPRNAKRRFETRRDVWRRSLAILGSTTFQAVRNGRAAPVFFEGSGLTDLYDKERSLYREVASRTAATKLSTDPS